MKEKGLVGLGNGPFAAQVIEYIAEKRKSQLKSLQGFQFVPATDTAAVEAAVHGLPVTDLTDDSQASSMCTGPSHVACPHAIEKSGCCGSSYVFSLWPSALDLRRWA